MHTPITPVVADRLMPVPVREADWLFAGRASDLLVEIVRSLQQRVGLTEAIGPLLEIRKRAVLEHPERAAEATELCNELLLRALCTRYDAMDGAVRDMSMPYAEMDRTGAVVYANRAFLAIAPESLGGVFADLFGPRADEVKAALTDGEATSLLLEMPTARVRFSQVRVVVGPLADEEGINGAFALLIDMGGDERLYDSAPDGILRINATNRITFANRRACELLGTKADVLVGRAADGIFRSGSTGERITKDFGVWSSSNEGKKSKATFLRHGSQDRVPIRASVLPTYHNRDRRAGTLIAFNTTTAETAHRKLQRLLAAPWTPDELAIRVLRTIRSVVPYDLATWGIYTPDMKFFRVLATDPHRDWPVRWWPVNPNWLGWLRTGKTWTSDLQKTVKEMDPQTLRDPVFREIQEKGLNYLLTLPIGGGNGSYRSAVSLLSINRAYDKSHYDTIRGLGVREAFNATENAFKRLRDGLLRELKRRLSNDTHDAVSLAEYLAVGIADCFNWGYVAIYKVDRAIRHFKVIAQHDATPDRRLTVDASYIQPFEVGMLHAVLESGERRVVPEIDENTPPNVYTALNKYVASAMAMPIRVEDEVEWIVDVASTERNAFEGPDMDDFASLMEEWQEALTERWHGHLRRALLAAADQALLVVDQTGAIRQSNPRAEDLFQLSDTEMVKRNIAEFGVDTSRAELQSISSLSPQPQILHLASGVSVPALMTNRPLHDDYDHRLFLFTDVRNAKWERNWRYLDVTVSEVARHTRVPLMMAQSLVEEAIVQPDPSAARGLLEHAVKQLMKADITFERLTETLSAHQPPEVARCQFDVMQLLRDIVDDFPPDDARCIAIHAPPMCRFETLGWPNRLGFVFRSLLGHLLSLRSSRGGVEIAASLETSGSLCLTLQLRNTVTHPPAAARSQSGPLEIAQHRAREIASLSFATLRTIVRRHRGDFEPKMVRGTPPFRVVLEPQSAGRE